MYALGIDVNNATEEDWQRAQEYLKKQKPLVQSYVMDEIFNKMEGGEAALAAYYAGDCLSMMENNESLGFYYPKKDIRTPAAIADPITPATFGPIACMRRKFLGFSFCPTTCDTRAAMGTAETPAEPIRGFIFPPDSQFIILAVISPPQVDIANATRPRAMMRSVVGFRKFSAIAVAPTVIPRNIVTIFIISF